MKFFVIIVVLILYSITNSIAQDECVKFHKELYTQIEYYSKVIKTKPTGYAFMRRADVYKELQNVHKSIEDLTNALEFYENDNDTLSILYSLIGEREFFLYRFNDAIGNFTLSINLRKNGLTYWHRGYACCSLSEYTEAINDYTKALTFYQNDSAKLKELYNNIDKANKDRDRLDKLNETIRLNPSGAAYLRRADFYNGIINRQKVIDDYTMALSFYKNNNDSLSMIYDWIGGIEKQLGFDKDLKDINGNVLWSDTLSEYKKSIDNYTKALKFCPQNDTGRLFNINEDLYIICSHTKKYKEAIESCNLRINLHPHGSVFCKRAAIYDSLLMYKKAIDDYTMALKFFKVENLGNYKDNYDLAVLYKIVGNDNSKLEKYKDAIESYDQSIVYNNIIANYEEVINICNLLINIKHTGIAFWQRGDAYGNLKEYQNAIDDYTKATVYYQNDSNNLSILYKRIGDDFVVIEKYKEAIGSYDQLIKLKPNGNTYCIRGNAYDYLKEYQKAIDDYKKALDYYQNDGNNLSLLYRNIGTDCSRLGKYKDAIDSYDLSISLNPDGYTLWKRANSYEYLSENQKAIDDYKKALVYFQNDSNNLSILYANIGIDCGKLEKHKDAIDSYDESIRLKPDGKTFWKRANSYENLSENQKAIDDYKKALVYFQNDSNYLSILYANIGVDCGKLEKYKEAIDSYNESIILKPDGSTFWNRASLYEYISENQNAIDDYTKALKFFQHDSLSLSKLYCNIGNNEKTLQKYNEAIDNYTKGITLYPLLFCYYNRAKTYQISLNNKADAINDFRKVIQLDNDSSYYSAASLCFLGDTISGYALMSKIINKSDDKKGEYYNMACIKLLMGEDNEALKYLELAITNGFNNFAWMKIDDDMVRFQKNPSFQTLLEKYHRN